MQTSLAIFDHNTSPKRDSVVIIAGGESSSNKTRISDYVKKNNSLVFAANYNYGVHADFTYFGDPDKFDEQVKNIKGKIIVSNKILEHKIHDKSRFFVIGTVRRGPGIYDAHRIQIKQDGFFPYSGIGTAGVACIVISLLCKPKKMLLVGFDGCVPDASVKKKFDGSILKYGKPKKRLKEMRYWTNTLAPSLHERGITVETFNDVKFFGLPKNELRINVI